METSYLVRIVLRTNDDADTPTIPEMEDLVASQMHGILDDDTGLHCYLVSVQSSR